MLSPLDWLNAAAAVAVREIQRLLRTPQEIIVCGFLPIFWVLVVWLLLGNGIVTQVPTGIVDNDHSQLSRDVISKIDATRSVALVPFASHSEADQALRNGSIYGFVEIPFGYSRDVIKGAGAPMVLYLDENRYAVAGTLQADLTSVATAISQERMIKTSMLTASGVKGAERLVTGLHSDFYALGNMQFSFLAFLGSNLVPGVIMLSAILSFVSSIVRENYQYRINEWFDTAQGSVTAALFGKLLPHFFFYSLLIASYIVLFAGFGGFAPAGSLFIWFICGAACLGVMACMGVLIVGIAPNWRFALVVTSGYAAPALPFTGFSMPLDSMSEMARMFCKCLPLTWFIEGQTQQWTLGAKIWEMGTTFTAFALLAFIPLIVGIPIFKWKYGKFAKQEKILEAKHEI